MPEQKYPQSNFEKILVHLILTHDPPKEGEILIKKFAMPL